MNTPRHLTSAERKLITDTLRELLRLDPISGVYKWVDGRWSNDLLTKRLNKEYKISPPLTVYNVQSVRQEVFGYQFKKGQTPPITKPTALKLPKVLFDPEVIAPSVSQLPLPLVPGVKSAQIVESPPPQNNLVKSLVARIGDLERRVTELEDTGTQPKKEPQRAPAFDYLDEQFPTGCA